MITIYKNVRNWMYRNARPIDIARWRFHFEHGTKEEVLKALLAYQNPDGGFGYGLEADCWNPNSSPLQTWCATEILYEIGMVEKNNPIVQGILKYLEECADYQEGYWRAEIPSNNEYPHAPWWSYGENIIEEWGYNPTICFAGFILYYGEEETKLYEKARKIGLKAVKEALINKKDIDRHELNCYTRFYDYCEMSESKSEFCTSEFLDHLKSQVKSVICTDKEAWYRDYVCRAQQYIESPQSRYYLDNKEIADYEVEFIRDSINSEGSYNVNWSWGDYPMEWAISKNWWMGNQCILNIKYLKEFGYLKEVLLSDI